MCTVHKDKFHLAWSKKDYFSILPFNMHDTSSELKVGRQTLGHFQMCKGDANALKSILDIMKQVSCQTLPNQT